MKKVYKIVSIETKEVCIPSTDYYSRGNDWQTETVNILSYDSHDEYETEELALEALKNAKYEFTILPFYKKQ